MAIAKNPAGRRGRVAKAKTGKIATPPPSGTRKLTASASALSFFLDVHKDNPNLQADIVYAIPPALVEAIKKEIPRFFSRNEEAFESGLAPAAGAGLFLGKPFSYPYSVLPERQVDQRETQRTRASAQRDESQGWRIHELWVKELKQSKLSEEQIERFFATKDRLARQLAERQLGYLGWLVTEPRFQYECDLFFRKCYKRVRRTGELPRIPLSILGQRQRIPKRDIPLYRDLFTFHLKWGIESFATPDLPLLLHPTLDTTGLYDISTVAAAGVLLFIPWYLLRDQHIKLYELVEHLLPGSQQEHLEGWLQAQSTKWGKKRYALMLQLYVFLELALKSRYGDRVNRNTERLDQAFGRFLSKTPENATAVDRMAENVKRVRLEMNQRLAGNRLKPNRKAEPSAAPK